MLMQRLKGFQNHYGWNMIRAITLTSIRQTIVIGETKLMGLMMVLQERQETEFKDRTSVVTHVSIHMERKMSPMHTARK